MVRFYPRLRSIGGFFRSAVGKRVEAQPLFSAGPFLPWARNISYTLRGSEKYYGPLHTGSLCDVGTEPTRSTAFFVHETAVQSESRTAVRTHKVGRNDLYQK